MNNTEEVQREMNEAALILLSMADAVWDSPHVHTSDDEAHAPQTPIDYDKIEAAESLLLLSTTTHVVHADDQMNSDLPSTQPVEDDNDDIPRHTSTSPASAAPDVVPDASDFPDAASSFTSVSTPVSNSQWAGLSADQQAIQQRRLDMSARQRRQHNLQSYDHVNAQGHAIGRLWQTITERRTFRQNQRRRSATLLRAATTRGRSFSNRHSSN
ncbi:unnamed protein product [Aureobasidium uvarum]|uniref:Uncharacterized protein n=1 Tax=Aureobasidium uvarum TaxID=2773716 RepID=A0A9N8PTA6_9PEZI|nr:unnamed protein product [Aureobasidium uvarum]